MSDVKRYDVREDDLYPAERDLAIATGWRGVVLESDYAVLAAKVVKLEQWITDLQSGMYVNCVYCGHRYGPGETTPVSMADVLKAHVEKCPQHPMSALTAKVAALEAELAKAREQSDWKQTQLECEIKATVYYKTRIAALEAVLAKRDKEHCKDCCCARSWRALGIDTYTGKSIPEHIEANVARIATLETALNRAADTFADFEIGLRLLNRPLLADACKIAYEDARLIATAPAAAPSTEDRRDEP